MSIIKSTNAKINRYLLSFGSNQGGRIKNLKQASAAAASLGQITKRSLIYESTAYGYIEQPAFLNALCLLESKYRPFRLLWKLKAIELKLGRTPSFRWGPREIDIDILEWNGKVIKTEILVIPHIELEKRRFVLTALQEIFPEYVTRSGEKILDLIKNCKDSGLVQLSKEQW
jgi:2-amino-4-hydroxy-6-hydroxymethyldihydropteridine diphosphokinase